MRSEEKSQCKWLISEKQALWNHEHFSVSNASPLGGFSSGCVGVYMILFKGKNREAEERD